MHRAQEPPMCGNVQIVPEFKPMSYERFCRSCQMAFRNRPHTVNAPRAGIPVQFGEKILPATVIVAAHYGVWAAVTLGVLLLAGVW